MRRTKEDTQKTRKAILEAAERVFFDQGIARTTLEQIARAAGLTRGAIYWHFQNKVDLINAVHAEVHLPMEEVFFRILDGEDADALRRLEDHCAASFTQLHSDERSRRVYGILLLKCEYSEEMSGLIERLRASKERVTVELENFFQRLQKAGRIGNATPPRVLALGLYAFMLGLYSDYLRYPDLYRVPEDGEALIRHFFAPLKVGAKPAEGTT
ncbi:TetR family transcriptional regulator [Geoalkalibacter halelectricus]|uniref:TetR family transcriptional regulator n=1 Tax=Geoalkalibacter halelectricus TaxID=2847045 RepID=UPI003D22E187